MTISSGIFSLQGKTAVVTGGTGALGSAIARGLAAFGARVGILGRRNELAQKTAQDIQAGGGGAFALAADVLEREELQAAAERAGQAHILVNCAGGNPPEATIAGDLTFFNLSREAYEQVLSLNLTGTLLPCQIFGRSMAERGQGSIINISSMAALQAMTRVLGYGNAKAGIDNFTRWLAVELAQKYGPGLRVNAISPGFIISDLNRNLLLDENGNYTERGRRVIGRTPQGRFGEPDELIGGVIFLASEAARFVTGTVIPIDGGFSAFSGV